MVQNWWNHFHCDQGSLKYSRSGFRFAWILLDRSDRLSVHRPVLIYPSPRGL
jgi:hypothetical protein